MYQTILKKFSEDGIHLNDEQDNFLRIFEKYLDHNDQLLIVHILRLAYHLSPQAYGCQRG